MLLPWAPTQSTGRDLESTKYLNAQSMFGTTLTAGRNERVGKSIIRREDEHKADLRDGFNMLHGY